MTQLYPSKHIETNFAKVAGCLVSLPVIVILFFVMIWLIIALKLQSLTVLPFFLVLAIGAVGLRINRSVRSFLVTGRHNLALRNLDEPTVRTSRQAIHVGDAFTLTYRQPVQQAVNITRPTLQLIRRSRVIRKRDIAGVPDPIEQTRDRVIQVVALEGRRLEPGGVFYQEVQLTIPKGEAPTSEAGDRYEEWLVRAHLPLTGWLAFQEEYLITVLPKQPPA